MIVALMLCFSTAGHALTVAYRYDGAGRLVSAGYGNGTLISYVYDNMGNMLSRRVKAIDIEPGNVFMDESIDLRDAIMAIKVTVKHFVPVTGSAADVNGDQKIGAEEAIYILNKLAATP